MNSILTMGKISHTCQPLLLCPLHICLFRNLCEHTGSSEATLLLSKILFHQRQSKINRENKTYIARTRKEVASWLGFSLQKVDKILNELQSQGLLEKRTGLWQGKKCLYLHASEHLEICPINFKKLRQLKERTGSLYSALVLSRIAFAFANTKIIKDGKYWCSLSREQLSTWSKLSPRTIDRVVEGLVSKGLLIKQVFHWKSKSQLHFHIPQFVVKSLCQQENEYETSTGSPKVIHNRNGNSRVAKTVVSIIRETKRKKTNNNTDVNRVKIGGGKQVCDIAFQKVGSQLTIRQQRYLTSALSRTLEQHNLSLSSPKAVLDEMTFSVLSTEQHKAIRTFTHRVNRCLKIIRDGRWRTPIGYDNHCESGRRQKQQREAREQRWQYIKAQECQRRADNIFRERDNERWQLTERALRVTARLKRLLRYPENNSESDSIFDYLRQQLICYLQQGADKVVVQQYFQAAS